MQIPQIKYVDLGLPSGLLWADGYIPGRFVYDDAFALFGEELPTMAEAEELISMCAWEWVEEDMMFKVIGPNGNILHIPGERKGESKWADACFWCAGISGDADDTEDEDDAAFAFIGEILKLCSVTYRDELMPVRPVMKGKNNFGLSII